MNYSIESFIDFCDDMYIANEGFIDRIKSFLRKKIISLLKKVEGLVNKIKNDKIRIFLMNIIKKLRRLFKDVDDITSTNSTEKSKEITEEYEQIKEEVKVIVGKDDINFDNTDERDLENTKDIQILRRNKAGRSTYFYKAQLSHDYADKVYDIAIKMDKADTFQEYIQYFKEFKRMTQLPNKCIIYALNMQMDDTLSCYYIVENKRPMKIGIDKALYHTSEDPDLTYITPSWRAERNPNIPLSGRFFDTPRAFFGVFPMNRFGRKVGSDDGLTIYKAEGISKAFIDVDGITFGTSVYVESSSPIMLTKVADD